MIGARSGRVRDRMTQRNTIKWIKNTINANTKRSKMLWDIWFG